MKKMLKAGLAVFTMAMLATSASAFSPAWDTPPDVLIGDCDLDGQLIFTDAFDVFSILSDADNTSPQLSVYFAEGPWDTLASRSAQVTDGNATSELTINTQGEIDYSGPGDVKLDDQSLLTGGELTAINNNLLFATGTNLIDRAVVLIASDGFTSPSVSKVFRVRSDLAECSDASLPVFVVNQDSWDTQAQFNADWAYGSFNISGTASSSGATGDALIINNPLAGQNLSFWQLSPSAPKIPATGIIRSRWTIRSSVAENQWPAVQMRVFEFDNHNVADLLVSAAGYVPPANTSRTYQAFYEAPADLTNDLAVAFFNVDTNDAQGGNFTLEQVVVDSIVGLDALFSPVQVIDSGESITFSSVVNIDFGASITFAQSAGSVTFTGATITGTNFAFEIGQLNNAVASAAANTLYRMSNTMTSTTAVNSQFGWGFRLFAGDNSITAVNRVSGIGTSSAVLATTTPKDYTTYLTSDGITGQPLFIALDILHNDITRAGNVTWDRSVIQAVDLGVIP